eukprot:scaffold922_cov327-Pinguiococcus_pyrenoidosus.AAC.2
MSRRSSLGVRRSAFVVRRSAFVARRSSFVARCGYLPSLHMHFAGDSSDPSEHLYLQFRRVVSIATLEGGGAHSLSTHR